RACSRSVAEVADPRRMKPAQIAMGTTRTENICPSRTLSAQSSTRFLARLRAGVANRHAVAKDRLSDCSLTVVDPGGAGRREPGVWTNPQRGTALLKRNRWLH